jgi:hypothetical protein
MREEVVIMAGRKEMFWLSDDDRSFIVVSVLLPIAVNFALRSEPQGGVKVLGMR